MPNQPTMPRVPPPRDPLKKPLPPDHKFNVGSFYRPGWPEMRAFTEPIPFLPLAGECLDRAGFAIGAQVWVEAEPGRLVVQLRAPATGGDGHGPRTR